MATWYSIDTAAQQERLGLAWKDAPLENLEVCGFILDAAKDQVLDYAPATIPTTFEPASVIWPTGETVVLTREGEIVTAAVDPGTDNTLPSVTMPWPAEHFALNGDASTTVFPGGNYALILTDVGSTKGIAFFATGVGPFLPGTARWLADAAPGDGVPSRYVYAQLQQAKNLLMAGSVARGGEYGDGEFTYEPRPLDKAIKNLIRPVDGKPHVL